MRMNASNSRVSTGMSLLSGGPEPGVPPLLRKSNIIYQPVTGQDRAPPHETDGSAPTAWRPSRRREPLHTFPPPAACIPSNSGSSGKPTAKKATALPCTNAKRGKKRPGKLGAMVVQSTEILGTQDAGALGKAGDAVTSRR